MQINNLWQAAVAHPGLAAQFTSPIGFAVTQMRRGNGPPPLAELDRWAERASRNDDRYESWRYVEAASITEAAITPRPAYTELCLAQG